jgi:phosphatidylserine/phosphatidylglycerophosphate/cardiolipin synthase-like enzyme
LIEAAVHSLLDAVLAIASNTPPEGVRQLAEFVRVGSPMATSLQAWPTNPVSKTRLTALVVAWQSTNISAAELAGLLLGAGEAYRAARAEQQIELVWTGPASSLVATRKTEQALLQVIEAAQAKLFVTSFVAYNVASILDALTKAIGRGVQVSMLLEASDQHGGSVSVDAIGMMKSVLPRARLLSWTEKSDAFWGGKVHAKCAVSDERMCFISSANLTGHAMEKNMEAGILIAGGAVPQSLHRHLEALATTGVIVKV